MQATENPQAGAPASPRSRGVGGAFRGLWAALRGIRGALGNRDVFRLYGWFTLALLIASLVLGWAMAQGVWALADLVGDGSLTPADGAQAGFVDSALDVLSESGRYVILVVGTLVAVVMAPVIAVLVVGLVLPVFADGVFFAALRPLNRARADELEARPGISFMTSMAITVRLLMRVIGFSLVAFAVGFIPVVGWIAAPAISIWAASHTLGWEMMAPYLGKLDMDYAAQKRYVSAHSGGIVGFGLPLSFVLAVPLVGPLFFGLVQAAAPVLLVDVLEP